MSKNIITIENLENLKSNLCYDKDMQQYVLTGVDGSFIGDAVQEMYNRIKNTPQINEMDVNEAVKVIIYKDYTKVSDRNKFIKYNTINVLLYVPIRLHDYDYRIYRLEDRIEKLFTETSLKGVGTLDYVSGIFVDSTLNGYSLFKMIFVIPEGNINGRY